MTESRTGNREFIWSGLTLYYLCLGALPGDTARAVCFRPLFWVPEKIKEVPHAKYLGVTIDQHLMWNEHIRQITAKANNVKSFLPQNLKPCPVNIKSPVTDQSMVRSILDYASTIWSPYTQKKSIQTLESVQRRSARFVFNDYSPYNSVSNMLT